MLGSRPGRQWGHDVVESVKHEMRGQLAGLDMLVEALQAGDASLELRSRMRAHARVLARKLALLADDLSLVSHLDPNAPRLVLEVIDLEPMVAECAALFPDVAVHLATGPDVYVSADAQRLRQILSNIIRGAQRRGSRPLFLYASDAGRTVTLRVPDPGPRDGHELFIVDLLVRAHGGRTSHDGISESLVISLPRAI